ncbi:MAG: hypothetical protein U0987_05310 [Afipia sp.]|nr:hypothetical protein [Afipia sp.]
MARRIDVVLEVMLAAIDTVDGASQAAFQADAFLHLGVERALEIISQGVHHIP